MASVVAESSPPETRTTAGDPDSGTGSAARDVAPEQLVQLHLEADRQPVREDPVRKLPGLELPVARREQHLAPAVQTLQLHPRAAPLVVGAIADHELELVTCAKAMGREVESAMRLAGARRLDVDDAGHARVHRACVDGTARLERHLESGLAQVRQEGRARLLCERLAPGDAHVPGTRFPRLVHQPRHGAPLPAVERVSRVAVLAAQRATGQADEET